MNTRKLRKLTAHIVIAAIIFIAATGLGDFIVGPIAVRVIEIRPQTSNHPWGIFLPFLIQNALVCLGFILARKPLSRVVGETGFFTSWLINAGAACIVGAGYIALAMPNLAIPVVYRKLGGDFGQAIWAVNVLLSAILPLSTYFQMKFASDSLRTGSYDVS